MVASLGNDGPGESVSWGTWTDHSTGETQIAVSDHYADVLKALVAVWLGLIAPYMLRLLQYPFYHILRFYERGDVIPTQEETQPINQNGHAAGPAQQSTPLRWQRASRVLVEANSSRDLFAKTVAYARIPTNRHKLSLALIGTVVFLSFLARTLIGFFSVLVATNKAALWASEHCGPYVFDSIGAGDDIAARADVYDREKESRAGAYAENCYRNESSSIRPLHCNFFYRQNIPFETTYTYRCPFPKQDICARGAQAVTFDTGLVDANSVGINDKHGYHFRRSTTCVPLNTDAPYVRNETADGIPAFSYRYGERIGRKDTFSSSGDPFNWLAPTYDVIVQSTVLQEEDDDEPYWTPIAALTPPQNTTLTIMFINPLHILYLKPSADPIFVADKAYTYPGDPVPVYYKNDAKYRVLSCLDTQQICLGKDGPCRPLKGDRRDLDDDLPPEYWILKWSLEHSDTYYSIAKRLGTALVAQEMISQYTSVPLSDRHWVVEAERLFATSLARIQYDVWSVGSGEDRIHVGEDGYRDDAPKRVRAKGLCGHVKFQSAGYTNISWLRFILLMSITPLLWLLNLEKRTVVQAWSDTARVWRWLARRRPASWLPASWLPVDVITAEGQGGGNPEHQANDNTIEIPIFWLPFQWVWSWITLPRGRA